jgi:DEAD/DEAH box helicase domain-containing protein
VIAGLAFGGEERRDGVMALSYTLGQLAALFLMCDRHDLGVAVGDNGQGEARVEKGLRRIGMGDTPIAPGLGYEPNVFLYDNYPGGIGLSEPLYRLHARLLAESRALIAGCPCRDGCPSCVGPAGEAGTRGKEVALALLDAILGP